MALYKSSDLSVFRGHIPVKGDFDMSLLLSFVQDAEQAHLIPYLGEAMYTELDSQYSSSSLTTDNQNLLNYAQRALAPLAAVYYMDMGNAEMSNQGIRITHDDHSKSAFAWQVHQMKESAFRIGMSRIDEMLAFLEKNASKYPTWTASPEYTARKENFINSAREFTLVFSQLRYSRSLFLLIKPLMERVEAEKIKPITGEALYDEIKAQILAGTLTTENKTILTDIRNAVAYLTIHRALAELPVRLSTDGLSLIFPNSNINTAKAAAPPRTTDLQVMRDHAYNTGSHYLGTLKGYLDTHYSDYPLYPYSSTTTEINDSETNKWYSV